VTAQTPAQRQAAHLARKRRATGMAPLTELVVTCWCEQSYVGVSPADVLNGRTGSCGAPGCEAGDET
jgi:hypothetical protein